MSQRFRLPRLHAGTQEEKLEQLRSYLYQLAEQLNQLTDGLSFGEQTETAEALLDRTKQLLLYSADFTNALKNQLQSTFVQKTQLEQGQVALRGPFNGTYLQTGSVDAEGKLCIHTRFSTFYEGDGHQVFFLFGTDGLDPVHTALLVEGDGTWSCDMETLQITTLDDTATVQITARTQGAYFTVLSADPFTLN